MKDLNLSIPISSIREPKEEFKNEDDGGVDPRKDNSKGELSLTCLFNSKNNL
jgi:hypothetical protein